MQSASRPTGASAADRGVRPTKFRAVVFRLLSQPFPHDRRPALLVSLTTRHPPPGPCYRELLESPVRNRLLLVAAGLLFSTGGAAIKASSFTGWQVASFRSAVSGAGRPGCGSPRSPARAADGTGACFPWPLPTPPPSSSSSLPTA